jgi:hypothetical protein
MMVKLTGCLNCDLDSYKASLGCCTCAKRTINAFKGSDRMLLRRFKEAKTEFADYVAEHHLVLEEEPSIGDAET